MNYVRVNDEGVLVKTNSSSSDSIRVSQHFTIPNFYCHTIANNLFANDNTLLSIKIPNSIVKIEKRAFFNCKNLQSVEMPEFLQTIDHCAFMNCSSLTSIKIADTVQTIGERAFYKCKKLEKANIPYYAQVGGAAFLECPNLRQLTYL